MEGKDFLTDYLEYTNGNEVPRLFHRWTAISLVGAFLGRNIHLELGGFHIYPNQYSMLIGVPGTRKSTAIKMGKKLLKLAGYDTFSADKSSKEKFLLDLNGDGGEDLANIKVDTLWGDEKNASEMFIAADEFNNFIGNGNLEFVSLLGELWDYEGLYSSRIKNGKSVAITNPTINILGGNTPTGFALAFPSDAIGQGFFSRLLLIYSDPSGKKITFPRAPDADHTLHMVKFLANIRTACNGVATVTPRAQSLLDKIYQGFGHLPDVRFEHYSNRRFTHLLKLSLIVACCRCSMEVVENDVLYANTILSHTEKLMPKALGEFGKSRNSDVTHKIISVLENEYLPMTLMGLWEKVSQDLEKITDLTNVLQGLVMAGKILQSGHGFLAKRIKMQAEYSDTIDYGFLSAEETGIDPAMFVGSDNVVPLLKRL